jgi:Ni,Fe-hydrogenase III large subunit
MSPAAPATGAGAGQAVLASGVPQLWEDVTGRIEAGARFAGLMATQRPGGVLLSAHLAVAGEAGISTCEAFLPQLTDSYPSLTPQVAAARWYEREIRDLFGLIPAGHPRLEPLILPLHEAGQPRPRPGAPGPGPGGVWPDEHSVPRHVMGAGMFTIPHGPVRSGVMESIEYLVETPGEDIPGLNMRVFYKHRGVEKRFDGLPVADGVLLAERTEGVASVAHALAYCHAAEQITGTRVPRAAALVRVLHAELERIASHLDTAARLADAAGLAVATARFGTHKERVLRLVGSMCGSRFGRGVVVPGGVTALPAVAGAAFLTEIARVEKAVTADARALMGTASFLDRLRRTGPLSPQRAREHGALGPVGKASGFSDDARVNRPYDAYPALRPGEVTVHTHGDALARLRVRWSEVGQSFDLLRQAAGELGEAGGGPLLAECTVTEGRAAGWAEAPQGEVLYDVRVEDGRLARCRPRSASFHNLVLFGEVFAGDILTDFPFIEASFGLSVAGVAL